MKNVIQYIESVICQGEDIESYELHKKFGKAHLKLTRYMIMEFAALFGMHYTEIGDYFELDHATVSYARKTIDNKCCTEKQFAEKMRNYKIELDSVLKSEQRDNEIIEYYKELDKFKNRSNKKIHLLKMLDPIEKKVSASEFELSILKNDLLTIRQEINKVAI